MFLIKQASFYPTFLDLLKASINHLLVNKHGSRTDDNVSKLIKTKLPPVKIYKKRITQIS